MIAMKRESDEFWKYLVLSLCILSILDLNLTIYELETDIAYEYNVILANFLELGYLPFILIKTNVTLLACAILWLGKDKILAKLGILWCNFVYFLIFLYHICGILFYA